MGCGKSRPPPDKHKHEEEEEAPEVEEEAPEVVDSGWNRYTHAESIFKALEHKVGDLHPVQLIRASYIVSGETNTGSRVLNRRQELPKRAFIGVEELRRIWHDGCRGGKDKVLPVISVSCGWETVEHPDPQGLHLNVIRKALKKQKQEFKRASGDFTGFAEMGVFWDWGSLHQGDKEKFQAAKAAALRAGKSEQEATEAARGNCRTQEEDTAFRHALTETMDLWFAHRGITVILANGSLRPEDKEVELEQDPAAQGAAAPPRRWFGDSGWVAYELCAARLLVRRWREVGWTAVQDIGRLTAPKSGRSANKGKDKAESSNASTSAGNRQRRLSITSASSAASSLNSIGSRRSSVNSANSQQSLWANGLDGRRMGSLWPLCADDFETLVAAKNFSHGPDREVVQGLYNKLSGTMLDCVELLDYSSMPAPNPCDARCLGACLLSCRNLRELNFADAGLQGKSMVTLCEVLGGNGDAERDNKPLQKLEVLRLPYNKHMHAIGVQALAGAFSSGAMNELKVLDMTHCSLHHDGAKALAKSFSKVCKLEQLMLEGNGVGDSGMEDIAKAASRGYLSNLVTLCIGGNHIGDDGAIAFVDAAHDDQLPCLSRLELQFNKIGDDGAQQLMSAVRANKLPKHMDLEGNRIGDRGMRALQKAGVEACEQQDVSNHSHEHGH